MATTAHTVTARKPFRCQSIGCTNMVQAGDEYAHLIAFPHDNDLGNDHFWRLRICRESQTEYGRPMPPRRRSRARNERGDTSPLAAVVTVIVILALFRVLFDIDLIGYLDAAANWLAGVLADLIDAIGRQ